MYWKTTVLLSLFVAGIQIQAQIAHAGIDDEVSVPPVLDSASLVNGRFVLKGHMPAGSGTPAGGYKTILNGSTLTDVSSQLNRSLGNLDSTQRQCFRLQGRWVQFDPIEFRSSNEICVDPLVSHRPILDKVKLSNGKYTLTARMPAGSARPAGGFKSIVDDVPQQDVSQTLSRSITGLDTSKQHCFQVQARWTEFSPIRFRSSNEVCHAGDSVTAEAPTLRKTDISHVNGRYRIAARMPVGSAIPAGGYRLLVNNVLRQGSTRQLSWALNDLDTSTEQCFKIQAYWTQIDSRRTSTSQQHCIEPIQSSASTLVFSSGFESGVSLTAGKADLAGADATGFDWQHDLEALPYVRGYFNNFVNGVEGRHFKVDLVNDPVRPGNRVLAMENIQIAGSPHSRPQGMLAFLYDENNPEVSIHEFSVELDLFFDSGFEYAETLAQPIGKDGFWFDFFEIWEHNGDDAYYDVAGRSRVSLNLAKDAGANMPLYFNASSQITPRSTTFKTQWTENNREVEVPLGRWFTLRAYFKAGGAQDGRFRISIVDNGIEKTVFDVHGATREDASPTAPSALQATKNYASANLLGLLKSHGKSLLVYYDNYRFHEGELK